MPKAGVFLHTGGVAGWQSLSEEPLASALIYWGDAGPKDEELGPGAKS